MTRVAIRIAALAVLLAVTAGGCGSAGTGAGRPARSTEGGVAASPPSQVTVVGEQSNNGEVDLASDMRLELVLHSTYWRVTGTSAPETLGQDGPAQVVPDPPGRCAPGAGCGVVRALFTARRAGSAVVTASRTSCGEAMRCTPGQGSFRLTVRVRG
jgi:hypothetical protein